MNKPSLLSKSKIPIVTVLMLLCAALFFYGAMMLFGFSVPMLQENFKDASYSNVGDRVLAKYDLAVQLSQKEDFNGAKKVLDDAFKELTHDSGVVPAGQKDLAARIQLQLGVVSEHQKNFRVAVSAYEESLRHNPQLMASKYNMERLKSKYPDLNGAGSNPQNPGGSSSGTNNKKGI